MRNPLEIADSSLYYRWKQVASLKRAIGSISILIGVQLQSHQEVSNITHQNYQAWTCTQIKNSISQPSQQTDSL